MGPRNNRKRQKRISLDRITHLTGETGNSDASKEAASRSFFEGSSVLVAPCAPSHTASTTWKSQAVKDKEEYERVRQRVRHFAPEQFKANAKPGRGRSEIFPQNVKEWQAHKKDLLVMAGVENDKNCGRLKAQLEARSTIPKDQRKVKSVFGEDGKVFKDGLSPVLGLPTIWSAEYQDAPAKWPSKGQLQWNGDSRECNLAITKCGRFLPPPLAPFQSSQLPNFRRALPLDETGPVYVNGPRPAEVCHSNDDMNNDPTFEEMGNFLLGKELMEEMGEWTPAFIPQWKQDENAAIPGAMQVYEDYNIVAIPEMMGTQVCYGGSGGWEQYPAIW